jgi:FkbM family methyltransferase
MHGCWLGSYEHEKQRLFVQAVRPGGVVYDVGAHVGFYTLLASVLVGSTGRVVAFEPFPRNLGYLRRHLELNRAENVTVVEGAVCDHDGTVRLRDSLGSSQVHVDKRGTLPVRAIMLDGFVYQDHLPPASVIKMDIEGSEAAALRGAMRLLKEKRPLLFLSTHGPEAHAECCRLLVELGYKLAALGGGSVEVCSELVAEG